MSEKKGLFTFLYFCCRPFHFPLFSLIIIPNPSSFQHKARVLSIWTEKTTQNGFSLDGEIFRLTHNGVLMTHTEVAARCVTEAFSTTCAAQVKCPGFVSW